MKYFGYTVPKMLIADEGKKIRDINDVYVAEHIDENGNVISEHLPYYTTTVFLADGTTEKQARELYIEEVD